jgi:hypothetical protein
MERWAPQQSGSLVYGTETPVWYGRFSSKERNEFLLACNTVLKNTASVGVS